MMLMPPWAFIRHYGSSSNGRLLSRTSSGADSLVACGPHRRVWASGSLAARISHSRRRRR